MATIIVGKERLDELDEIMAMFPDYEIVIGNTDSTVNGIFQEVEVLSPIPYRPTTATLVAGQDVLFSLAESVKDRLSHEYEYVNMIQMDLHPDRSDKMFLLDGTAIVDGTSDHDLQYFENIESYPLRELYDAGYLYKHNLKPVSTKSKALAESLQRITLNREPLVERKDSQEITVFYNIGRLDAGMDEMHHCLARVNDYFSSEDRLRFNTVCDALPLSNESRVTAIVVGGTVQDYQNISHEFDPLKRGIVLHIPIEFGSSFGNNLPHLLALQLAQNTKGTI